jgi:2-keto-4-pentenoate hydratase/2-oxohepta-3-ene-1,7-dioic acid hydratase in catechol pathway
MYLLRYLAADNTVQHGYLEGEKIGSLSGDLFGDFVRGGLVARLDEVRLLPPVQPGKIISVTFNFADRLRELDMPAPELPPIFFKAPSAIIGPGDAIRLPALAKQVAPGGELAVVIGRAGRWITPEDAPRHILGYTCANDILALDIANLDQTWTRASSFDTFCPLGPAIATHVNPAQLMIRSTVNGATRQMSSSHDMLFGVPQVIAFISAAMTLWPGDVILMGSPAGAGLLEPGDKVEVVIEGIGALSNPVVSDGGAHPSQTI